MRNFAANFNDMRKVIFIFVIALIATISINAQNLNSYKYVFIEHQEDAAKDIEQRMQKEFPVLGFVLLSEEEYQQLNDADKALSLIAKYRCRQSAECIFKLELINSLGEQVYEDEQISGAGFMSRKNDRQSALKKYSSNLQN